MFGEVRFATGEQGIYSMKRIKILEGNVCTVKHNGCSYEATLLNKFLDKTKYQTLDSSTAKEVKAHSLDIRDISYGPDLVDINGEDSPMMRSFDTDISMEKINDNDDHDQEKRCSPADYDITGYSDNSVEDPDFSPNLPENSSSLETSDEYSGEKIFRKNESNLEVSQAPTQSPLNILLNTSMNHSTTCDKENLHIESSRGKLGDKKFNVCVYCLKKQFKIARHLETMHAKETEVQNFLYMPKGSQERRDAIACLRRKGNFIYNTKENINNGDLIVSRRPNIKFKRTGKDYKACANCKGFFSNKCLRVHFKNCTGLSSKTNRIVCKSSRAVEGRIHKKATATVQTKLFPALREDDIVKRIRYDELIIIYANKMCVKYKNERYYEMIRQRLRLLGRFKQAIGMKNKEITDLKSVYAPKHCEDAINAIHSVAGLNQEIGDFKTPTVASTLGTLIKQIGQIFINECIIADDEVKHKNVKNFLKLFTQEFSINTNRAVTESQVQIKRRKIIDLPSTRDIKLLHYFLHKKQMEALSILKEKFRFKSWYELMEMTLLSIQIFNRRRAGEVERIFIEDYKTCQGISNTSEIYLTLSAEERELANKYVRFEIRGKLNRTVAVILNKKQVHCIETILNFRNDGGVSELNPYLFGTPGYSSKLYLNSCKIMRKYSMLCGAEQPERLRGTKLRKHMATTCIKFNLEDKEVTDLAAFMGHHEKIHKNIYRQPVLSKQILRMSQLLKEAQGGSEDDSDESLDENMSESYARDKLNQPSTSKDTQKKRSVSPYGPVKRRRWTEEEKRIIRKLFADNIESEKLPSLNMIKTLKASEPGIQLRTSPQIKTYIHNQIKARNSLMS